MASFTMPTLAGLGGAGLVTFAIDGKVQVCDGFGAMPGLGDARKGPRKPTRVMLDFEGIPVEFRIGASTIAVPGTVASLWELHRRHGRAPMADVAAPAIAAARHGVLATRAHHSAFTLLRE